MTARKFVYVCAGIFLLAPALLTSPAPAQPSGYVYVTQWGTFGSGNGQFDVPAGVATDAAGNVYVADLDNDRIQKFASTGTYITQWGTRGTGDGQFDRPYGVATDAAGNVYVADGFNHRIQKFTSGGTYLTQWDSSGTGNGQFVPSGVATDAAGDLYVLESVNNRIQKFAPDHSVSVPVTGPTPTFAIEGVYPNPARSKVLTVQFDLPTAAPANLQVLDIVGRRVADWDLGSPGTGRHSASLATGARLPPGVYAVRLTQGLNQRTAPLVVE